MASGGCLPAEPRLANPYAIRPSQMPRIHNPDVKNVRVYMVSLDDAIDHFLNGTVASERRGLCATKTSEAEPSVPCRRIEDWAKHRAEFPPVRKRQRTCVRMLNSLSPGVLLSTGGIVQLEPDQSFAGLRIFTSGRLMTPALVIVVFKSSEFPNAIKAPTLGASRTMVTWFGMSTDRMTPLERTPALLRLGSSRSNAFSIQIDF